MTEAGVELQSLQSVHAAEPARTTPGARPRDGQLAQQNGKMSAGTARTGVRFIESSSKIHGSPAVRDPQCVEEAAVSSPSPTSETIRGACGHDCPDTCSWIVEVRDGTAQTLTGDPGHPFTRGRICAKVND